MLKQHLNLCRVFTRVAKRVGICQSESEWLCRVVKADEPQATGNVPGGAQHRKGIGRRAQSDIPHDELARAFAHPLGNFKLAHVQQIGLGSRAETGMHFLVIGRRVNRLGAIGQADEFQGGAAGLRIHNTGREGGI